MTRSIVVVGGGCSGVLVATELLRQAERPFTLTVVEPAESLGRGLAYGTLVPMHLLNVPAARISARTDEPDHFLRWLQVHVPQAGAGTFAPRALYGRYLQSLLHEAIASAPRHTRFEHLRERVVDVQDDGRVARVHLTGGAILTADAVVLAVGNLPSAGLAGKRLGGADPERFVANPWAAGALDFPNADRPVFVIGTGLTAVDVALALRHRGHWGTIHAISRHGLLPLVHGPSASPGPVVDWNLAGVTALSLLRQIRANARAVRGSGDWRAVVDALRPRLQDVWSALPVAERRRFLRHLRPYWDVHRHRMSGEAASLVRGMLLCGALRITAGRVAGFARHPDGVSVSVVERNGGRAFQIVVAHVVDCTGPAPVSGSRDPLLRRLLASGLARTDTLGLGLDADPDGGLTAGDGRSSPRLFALGPLLKGMLWETTAVPEIRGQARALAARLLADRGRAVPALRRPQGVRSAL